MRNERKCQNSEEDWVLRLFVRFTATKYSSNEERSMNCPHCMSAATKEQIKKTALGYRTFRCSDCRQTFYERIGPPFNFLEYPYAGYMDYPFQKNVLMMTTK